MPVLGNYKSKHPLPLAGKNVAFETDMYQTTPMQTDYHPTLASTQRSAKGSSSNAPFAAQRVAVPEIRALQALREIVGEDAPDSILVEVIDCYLEETPKLLQSLDMAAEIGDVAKIRALAHTLKPSSATIGALSLFQLCQELEAMVRADNTRESLILKVQQILCEYEQVEIALQAERSSCQL